MEKTAQSVLFIRCCYSGEIKLTGVDYRAHIYQMTNKHKIIIQQMQHTCIMYTLMRVWISVPWTLLGWAHCSIHGGHIACCCSQLYIYYRMLLQWLGSAITFHHRTYYLHVNVNFMFAESCSSSKHFIIFDLQPIWYFQFVGLFKLYVHTKFHIPTHKQ